MASEQIWGALKEVLKLELSKEGPVQQAACSPAHDKLAMKVCQINAWVNFASVSELS